MSLPLMSLVSSGIKGFWGKKRIPLDSKDVIIGLVFILYLGDMWSLILPMKVISR